MRKENRKGKIDCLPQSPVLLLRAPGTSNYALDYMNVDWYLCRKGGWGAVFHVYSSEVSFKQFFMKVLHSTLIWHHDL